MLICQRCKKEMKCIKMGVRCRWYGTHVYAGDTFECSNCKIKVIHCNSTPHYCNDFDNIEDDIWMDSYYEENLAHQTSINFRRKRNG